MSTKRPAKFRSLFSGITSSLPKAKKGTENTPNIKNKKAVCLIKESGKL